MKKINKENINNDIEKIRELCPACKVSFSCFKRMGGHLIHLDLLATYEAGAIYDCKAEELIKKYVLKYDNRDNPLFDDEFAKLYGESMEFENNLMTV